MASTLLAPAEPLLATTPETHRLHRLRCIEYLDSTIHQIEAVPYSLLLSDSTPSSILIATLKESHISLTLSTTQIHTIPGVFTHIKVTSEYLVALTSTEILVYSLRSFLVLRRLSFNGSVWAIDVCEGVLAVAGVGIQLYMMPCSSAETDGDASDCEDVVSDSIDSLVLLKHIPFPHKSITLTLSPFTIYVSTSSSLLFALPVDLYTLLHPSTSLLSTPSLVTTPVRIALQKPQICWDILVTSSQVMCALSSGTVEIYAKSNFTHMQSVKGHLADVLCLGKGEGEDRFYSSGVDRCVVGYRLVDSTTGKKWVVAGEKRYHSHDVKAIKVIDGKILTGGVDQQMASVTEQTFPNTRIARSGMFGKDAIVVSEGRRVVGVVGGRCDVWELSEPTSTDIKHVCEIVLSQSSPQQITHAALSPDQTTVALATLTATKVFSLNPVKKVATLPHIAHPLFSRCGKRLVGIESDASSLLDTRSITIRSAEDYSLISQIFLAPQPTDNESTRNAQVDFSQECVTSLKISPDTLWLAVSTFSTITLYNLDTTKHHYALTFSSPITALAFSTKNLLAVVTADCQVVLVDVEERRVDAWTQRNMKHVQGVFGGLLRGSSKGLVGADTSTRGAFWMNTKLVIYGISHYLVLDTTKDLVAVEETRKLTKKQKLNETESKHEDPNTSAFRICYDFQSILYMGRVGAELCVVERPLLKMMEALPEAFYKKTFAS